MTMKANDLLAFGITILLMIITGKYLRKERNKNIMLQEAKALPLTQKDREVIEYFFNHFELDGFIIHGPVKEMSAEERLSSGRNELN